MVQLSRKATCNSHGQVSSYFLGWEEYEKNPYDVTKNPQGIIQMGLAENQVNKYYSTACDIYILMYIMTERLI
jgi:hypothetical protein